MSVFHKTMSVFFAVSGLLSGSGAAFATVVQTTPGSLEAGKLPAGPPSDEIRHCVNAPGEHGLHAHQICEVLKRDAATGNYLSTEQRSIEPSDIDASPASASEGGVLISAADAAFPQSITDARYQATPPVQRRLGESESSGSSGDTPIGNAVVSLGHALAAVLGGASGNPTPGVEQAISSGQPVHSPQNRPSRVGAVGTTRASPAAARAPSLPSVMCPSFPCELGVSRGH